MAIELVTGHAGEGHVSSADTGRFNAGICGSGKYVLATGQQFAYTVDGNNLVQIASGDAVNQGRHIIIPQNTHEDVAIENGVQGKTRIDVIALRYSKTTTIVEGEAVTTESASVVVIKGTEVATGSVPAAPAVTSGDIFDGDTVDDMPLYNVLITDTTLTSVTAVFQVLDHLASLKNMFTQYTNELLDKTYPIGSIYMSVSSANPGTLFGGTWARIQGRFLLGASSNHAAGATGGAEDVTLTEAQMPAHTHSIPAHTHSVPNHTHTVPAHTHSVPNHTHTVPAHTHSVPNHTHTVPAHTHTATTATAGNHYHNVRRTQNAAAGTAHYSFEGSTDVYKPTLEAGAHTHAVTVASKPAFNTTSSGSCTTGSKAAFDTTSSGACTTGSKEAVSTTSSGACTSGSGGNGTTGSKGSGNAVGIMPPYISVYIWKRTA